MASSLLPRTSKACDPCRRLKVRCLPATGSEICQKCLRSGEQCVFDDQRPPRKKAKHDLTTRFSTLEGRLEDLIAQVDHSRVNQRLAPDSTVWQYDGNELSQADLPTAKLGRGDSAGAKSSCYEPRQGPLLNPPPTSVHVVLEGPSKSAADEITLDVLLADGVLSYEAAATYLDEFREMCLYFPFIFLSPAVNIYTMLNDQPLLLHAILAVASSENKELQQTLERGLRPILLQRIMLKGQRRLEHLQGLLVYLAWYHFFLIPKKESSYQLLQMAITLCVDMGLNMRPSEAFVRPIGLQLEHHLESGGAIDDEFYSKEARRAYLGCYYLSTIQSWVWGKPNNTAWSDHMAQCAMSLAKDQESPSDAYILPLLESTHLGDSSHQTWCLWCARSGATSGESARAHFDVVFDRFRTRMSAINLSERGVAPKRVALYLNQIFCTIHAHEMDLLNPFAQSSSGRAASSNEREDPKLIPAKVRSDALQICLDFADQYLKTFLSIPWAEYSRLCTAQWTGLVYSTVVLYRLCTSVSRAPEWDVQQAREKTKLELYLESLCYRMQNITKSRAPTTYSDRSDLYSVTGLIYEDVRASYERLKQLPIPSNESKKRQVHATSFPTSKNNELTAKQTQAQHRSQPPVVGPAYQSRCPAFQFWGWGVPHNLQQR